MCGIAVYLASAWTQGIKLGGAESNYIGNRGVLITFVISIIFPLGLLGQLLGLKDVEHKTAGKLATTFAVGAMAEVAEDKRLRNEMPSGSELPSRPLMPVSSTSHRPEMRNSDSSGSNDLINALKEVAAAHRACAAANAQLVRTYEKT